MVTLQQQGRRSFKVNEVEVTFKGTAREANPDSILSKSWARGPFFLYTLLAYGNIAKSCRRLVIRPLPLGGYGLSVSSATYISSSLVVY